jgi:hypothetical protein
MNHITKDDFGFCEYADHLINTFGYEEFYLGSEIIEFDNGDYLILDYCPGKWSQIELARSGKNDPLIMVDTDRMSHEEASALLIKMGEMYQIGLDRPKRLVG